jgi:trans-aconitate methyltransferase
MVQKQGSREWNAEAYHRLSRPQFEWGLKVLDRLPLRGNERLADAGCGSGKITAELVRRLPCGRVLAIDLSQNMLQTARAHLELFAGRVFFINADLRDLPFDSVLDGIFSTAAFHWVRDHDRLFRSLFRALKPGGWLEAQCGGGPNLARVRERAVKLMSQPEFAPFFEGWHPPTHYEDEINTARRLRAAGFIEVNTWIEESPAILADAQEYKEFLATVTLHSHIARISHPVLRDRFLDELALQAGNDDPPFTLDYWRLNLSGRKSKD